LRLDPLVGNLGPEYVDEFQKQILILKRRRAAVRTVINQSLKKNKILVVNKLNQQINDLENLISAEKK